MGSLAKRFPLYSKLLRFYPAPYRDTYGEQMLQTLADMLDNAPSAAAKRLIWLRAALDLPLSAAKQQLKYTGGIMANETPTYIKRTNLIGAILLMPFFILLVLNSTIGPLRMQRTWAWGPWVLAVGLIMMPAIALALELGALLCWALARRRQEHISVWRGLFDIRRNWPLLGIAALGFGIILLVFGHDSVHCVAGNPVRELRNWHTTWQCIQQR